MKLFVVAKPRAKENSIKEIDDSHFAISVKEPPVKGRANFAILETLSDYLGVTRSQLKIISGYTSRNKVIEFYEGN